MPRLIWPPDDGDFDLSKPAPPYKPDDGSHRRTPEPHEINPIPTNGQKVIFLSRGYHTVVDESAYTEVSKFSWYASIDCRGKVYAKRRGKKNEGELWREMIALHRQIAGVIGSEVGRGIVIDHITGNSLNNTYTNLCPGNHAENMGNLIYDERGSSKYRGVCVSTLNGQYNRPKPVVAYFSFRGERHWCGSFARGEEELAARARDAKVIELLGDWVHPVVLNNILNFPVPIVEETIADCEDIPF